MTTPAPDTFVIHARQLLTMPEAVESLAQYDAHANDLRARDAEITGLIEDACVFIKEGKISWFGPWRRRPKATKKKGLRCRWRS